MSTLAQLRDLRRRLAESDRLRSTLGHAADVAALDALLSAVDHRDQCVARHRVAMEASLGDGCDGSDEAFAAVLDADDALAALLRGES